jgi:hypothetical protein
MLSPDITTGAFESVLPPRPGITKASADRLIPIIVVPAVVKTIIVVNMTMVVAFTMRLFFFLFLRWLVLLPSTNTIDKRIPLIGE